MTLAEAQNEEGECSIAVSLTPGSGISVGKDIKQGDDDGMQDENEGVHLAQALKKGRRRLVVLRVQVGIGRRHIQSV